MTRNSNTSGWNLDQGLAAQYAAQAGLDPDLAADAGEEVWDVLKSLRDATSETDPKRQAKLVRRTKTRLAKVLLSKAGLSRHGELVQHIEAKLLALQGRGGDTELAHLTPGEMIVPPQLQTPEVVHALQQAANNTGIDLRRYTAGSPVSRVNPETGLEEFSVECADEGGCRQEPGGYRGPNIYDYGGTTYVNVTGTSTSPTGRYNAYSADNWAGGPGGTGPIGVQLADAGGGGFASIPINQFTQLPDPTFGGSEFVGGGVYGPQPEETAPIEEIVVTAPHPDKSREYTFDPFANNGNDEPWYTKIISMGADLLLTGKPSVEELGTLSDEQILEEVKNINSHIIAYENMESSLANKDTVMSGFYGQAVARNMAYLDRLLGMCGERGLTCETQYDEWRK